MKKENLRKLNACIASLIVICLFIIVNVLSTRLLDNFNNLAVENTGKISLSAQSREILSSLKKNVRCFYIVSKENEEKYITKTAKEFVKQSDNFVFSTIDPDASPNFFANFIDEDVENGDVLVVCDKKSCLIKENEMISTETVVDKNDDIFEKEPSTIIKINVEKQLLRAIDFVSSDSKKKVYVVSGFENNSNLSYVKKLTDENISVDIITIRKNEKIPRDASCLMFLGVTNDLTDYQYDAVLSYINNGGKIYLSINFFNDDFVYFNKLMNLYGVEVNNDPIRFVDSENRFSKRDFPIYVPNSSITTVFKKNTPFSVSSSYSLSVSNKKNIRYSSLVSSKEETVQKDYSILCENQVNSSVLIVVGTSEFIDAGKLDENYTFSDFFVNGVAFLAQMPNSISIHPTTTVLSNKMKINGNLAKFVLLVIMVIPILISIIVGAIVIKRRNSHEKK